MLELAARLLAEKAGTAHPASLSRFLRVNGFSSKKTLLASETDRADVVHARRVWGEHRQPWMKKRSERLIFIDGTGTTIKVTRLRGRARRRQRLKMKAPFGHWGTQTFIAVRRHGYARDFNPCDPADRFLFDDVVVPDALRDELIPRFAIYSRRPIPRIERRNGVMPV